ncbi:MAG: geranylgeranylglyceryl/heptaprenylglyceryl phosphate synthase [Microscillaceae bacterium]|jgi:putative glycerol-1-phosphate prenyltransferase|nr:geranylgeranylglyceryl/heptaprenylglyceryl phosphate synthase [Microscillaceae bacterium]
MTNKIYQQLIERKRQGIKSFTLLIDPDKFNEEVCGQLLAIEAFQKVDFIFVGGSLIQGININQTIQLIKQHTTVPIVIFPGSNMHIDMSADGILFLSLISGRNPDFLIGQHIVAAPILKKSKLEILATGYMLVEGGKQTTASYMSNTTPLPYDKPEVAACTAMAGEMLGLKLIYADTGSGAEKAVSNKMVNMISKSVDIPLLVGGGIKSAVQAIEILESGADVIVIGNAIESNPQLLPEVAEKIKNLNEKKLNK